MTLKILLVDDNRTFMASVKNLLSMYSPVQIVGEAYDGVHALEMGRQLAPDLVLLDIVMPGMSGLDVARAMKAWPSAPKILFLSLHDNIFYRAAARELGCLGLVGKANFVMELLPLIAGMLEESKDDTSTDVGAAS
ncbi:MAG: response regulator transcription factor [Rhodoferax sp.]|uniref:response regulator n=1 Tax=Rhodoferax sp. TaxID=50421 RepID=UPI001B766160|nr:response regulator transcription factor [Rhodoferax sp.]MBP9904983.1 response regulator transcription factor [Rhodoferax sp.]